MTTQKNPEICQNVIDQLGGMALRLLGAKNLMDLGNGLSLRVRGSKAVNYISIKLAEDDTYTVRTAKIGRAPNYKMSNDQTLRGVYVDQLHALIEDKTGLYTSF